mgnify:FL=1
MYQRRSLMPEINADELRRLGWLEDSDSTYPGPARWCDPNNFLSWHTLGDAIAIVAAERRSLLPKSNNEMSEAILHEIGKTLNALGCAHGPGTHEQTSPMFYAEWIRCVVARARAEQQVETLDVCKTFNAALLLTLAPSPSDRRRAALLLMAEESPWPRS